MRKFLIKGFIVCLLAINAKSETATSKSAPPLSLNVEFETTNASVSINGMNIIPAFQFYFANRGWKTIYNINVSKMKISEENGKTVARMSEDVKGIGKYDLKISWSETKVELDYEYDIPAGNEVKYCVADIFLARNIFFEAKRKGIKKAPDNQFRALASTEEMEIQTEIGIFKFAFKTEQMNNKEKASKWLLRDASPQKFRSKIFRTLSILNCLERDEKNSVRQKLSVIIKYFPSKSANKIVKVKGYLELVKKLKKESAKLKLNSCSKLEILEKEFEKLQRKEGFSQAEFEDASKKIKSLAKEISLHKKTYANENIIIPEPQKTELTEGHFTLENNTTIIVPTEASVGVKQGAKVLQEELKDYFGINAHISKEKAPEGKKAVYLGSLKNEPFKAFCHSKGIAPPKRKEGYILKITPEKIFIAGHDSKGAFYGVQSLLQLLRKNSEGKIEIPSMTISDWPEIETRGMMLIPGRDKESFAWLKLAIRRLLARHKFNFLVLGEASAGNVRWKSHPEIARKNSMSVDILKENVNYAKEHLLEVAPLVQSLGHSKTVLKAHPELADSPDPNFPGNALCLSNPKTRKLLADLYDEAIEIYGKPKYFHIGLDEAMTIGKNPLCKGKKPDELVAEHVKWCNNYLKGKGVKNVILWHDMLLESGIWKDAPANSNSPGIYDAITHPAVTNLPKDVIIAMWSYRNTGTFPSVPYFQKQGYKVLCSPWFEEKNNYDIAASAHRNKAMGVLGTSWAFTTGVTPGTTSLLCAENSWTPGKPAFKDIPYDSRERLQAALLPPAPSGHSGTQSTPLDIKAFCNRSLRDEIISDGKGWADKGGLFDMSLLPEGRHNFGNINFSVVPFAENKGMQCVAVAGRRLSSKWNVPESVKGIKVDSKAKSLVFLQTCLPCTPKKIGNYTVVYNDNSSIEIPIVSRRNIFSSTKAKSYAKPHLKRINNGYIPYSKRIWIGWNMAGEEIDLQGFEWTNPHPEKTIKSLNLNISPQYPNGAIFLLSVSVVN